jgi:hypothetical protein
MMQAFGLSALALNAAFETKLLLSSFAGACHWFA